MWKRDQEVRERHFRPGAIPTHQTGQRLIERFTWKANADHLARGPEPVEGRLNTTLRFAMSRRARLDSLRDRHSDNCAAELTSRALRNNTSQRGRLSGISTRLHQAFFDAVVATDKIRPFASPFPEAMKSSGRWEPSTPCTWHPLTYGQESASASQQQRSSTLTDRHASTDGTRPRFDITVEC
jgi:hypothetical protein